MCKHEPFDMAQQILGESRIENIALDAKCITNTTLHCWTQHQTLIQ